MGEGLAPSVGKWSGETHGERYTSPHTVGEGLAPPVKNGLAKLHGCNLYINTKRTVGTGVLDGPFTDGLIKFHVFGPSRTPVPTVYILNRKFNLHPNEKFNRSFAGVHRTPLRV